MRRLLRSILLRPVMWATAKFSSKPNRSLIFKALDQLAAHIRKHPGQKGLIIPFSKDSGRFIIFSDQHKGARNGADDFAPAEPGYLAALDHYNEKGFTLISLGDSEELWENSLARVKKANERNFAAESKFIAGNRFIKVFGNHDLFWDNDPFAGWQLKEIYKEEVNVYEGVILSLLDGARKLDILCTHGHQGDAQSDGNWFSKFFVARIWAPLQAYLLINPNTPAYDNARKSLHNDIMYEWSSRQEQMWLITGHTHQPVFASLTHLERMYKYFQQAQHEKNTEKVLRLQEEIRMRERDFAAVSIDYMNMQPTYFNSGCCCYPDGDITGIEIEDGRIRLIKWKGMEREVLEEMKL